MTYTVYRRNNVVLAETIVDETGQAVNLHGVDIYYFFSGVEKSIGAGITVSDEAAGKIEIELTADDTDITPGFYDSEVLLVDAEGRRWSGKLKTLQIKNNLSYNKEVD